MAFILNDFRRLSGTLGSQRNLLDQTTSELNKHHHRYLAALVHAQLMAEKTESARLMHFAARAGDESEIWFKS